MTRYSLLPIIALMIIFSSIMANLAKSSASLQIMLNDHRQAWDMQPSGAYVQRTPRGPEDFGTQQALMALARSHGFSKSDPTTVP